MKRFGILILIGVALLGGGFLVFRLKRPLPEVRVMVVKRGDLTRTIQVEGVLHAASEAEIAPEVSGKILDVRVEEEDMVEAGDTLVVIDPSEYQARVLELEAQMLSDQARLAKMKRDWERAQVLLKDSLISPVEVENLESDLQALEAQIRARAHALEEARARLSKTIIQAPFRGTVLRVYRQNGEQAIASAFSSQDRVLMVLADLTAFYAEVLVDETEIPYIRPGMEANVRVEAFPQKVFPGKVERIVGVPEDFLGGGTGDEGTLFPVRIRIESNAKGLLPGMNLQADIVISRKKDALRIARAALGRKDGEVYVWRLKEGRVERVPIQTGMRAEFFVEVVEGLEEGDTVVVGPSKVQRTLREGQRVRWEMASSLAGSKWLSS